MTFPGRVEGGGGDTVRHGPSPAGPPCCMCGQPAWGGQVWIDPANNPTVACRPCLVWLGETELELKGGR